MRAHGMLGKHTGMTSPTIDRIEPAPVLAFVGADMTIKTIRLAVRALCVGFQIDLIMALDAGVRVLSVSRQRREQQDSENDEEIAHESAHFFGLILAVTKQHRVNDQAQKDQTKGQCQEPKYLEGPLSRCRIRVFEVFV